MDDDLRPPNLLKRGRGWLGGIALGIALIALIPSEASFYASIVAFAVAILAIVVGSGRALGAIAIPVSLIAFVWNALFAVATMQRGRPFRRRGRELVAPVGDDQSWIDPSITVEKLDAERAAHWTRAAQSEHASVAAFAALSLDLLAHGAPPELLEAAQKAALDEIRHARSAFALASAYAGRAISPAEWPEAAAPLPSRDLVRDSIVDGCFNEGVSARMLAAEAAGCDDPELRRTLTAIAEDEARHAELGWAIVEWRLAVDPRASDALARALVELRRRPDPFGVIREIEARARPFLGARAAA